MSRHHRAQKWTTHSPKLREQLEALMRAQGFLPCVNCGRPVLPEHKWQVGHIIDAAAGGRPQITNVGAVHKRSELWPTNCNQVAGGKRGAAVTNAHKRNTRNESEGIRKW